MLELPRRAHDATSPGHPSAGRSRFVTVGGQTYESDRPGHLLVRDRYDIVEFERVPPAKPTLEELGTLTGTYVSGEAETTVVVAAEDDALVLRQRPDVKIPLTPIYKDAFVAPRLGMVIFRRDSSGRVSSLSVAQERVWDMRFARQSSGNTR